MFYKNILSTYIIFVEFRARVLIGTAWILAGIFSLPSLILFQEETETMTGHNFTMCMMNLPAQWHWQV